MPDLGEEMGDVAEEREEVIALVEDNLSIFAEALVEDAQVEYDADKNNVRVSLPINDQTANRIEEEFDGVNVTNRNRATLHFDLDKTP